jgi:hypothetical protein
MFNARSALSKELVRHINLCERCGGVFRALLPSEILTDEDDTELGEADEQWENAVCGLAFGEDAIDAESAQIVVSAGNDYQRAFLKNLRESSDYAESRIAEAGALPQALEKTPGARLEIFFNNIASAAAGAVSDLKGFLSVPDFSEFVPAGRFRALAATAAPNAPTQYTAEGRLPNGGAYKLLYRQFETLLEIDAFKLEPPRVLYYRASGGQTAFEQHSSAWTLAKPDKWTMKLSADHPAIIALPEFNYVILAQSYKSLQKNGG